MPDWPSKHDTENRDIGWHELRYRAEALFEEIGALQKRAGELISFVSEGYTPPGGTAAAAPSEPPKVPDAAARALIEYELDAAQEEDRLETSDEPPRMEDSSSSALAVGRKHAEALVARVLFLESASERLEEVTNWIESFRKTDSHGPRFGDYEARVHDALCDYQSLLTSASEAAAGLLDTLASLQRWADKRAEEETAERQKAAEEEARAQERRAKQLQDRENSEREARQLAAREFDVRAHEAAQRSPNKLASLLAGNWVVTAVGPGGQRDIQNVTLERHRIGQSRYRALSRTTPWQAEGVWIPLNGVQVRFDGRSSAVPGGPAVAPFTEIQTFDVMDAQRLHSVSTQNVHMEWQRA